jgi:hypothetical protein
MDCGFCEKPFKKTGRNQKFCSRSCGKKAYWRNHPDYRRKHAKLNAEIRSADDARLAYNEYMRLRRYDFTKEQLVELWERQERKCAICSIPILQDAPIDHDHETGKVRGLLCHKCNRGLGQFEDSLVLLQKAIVYLKEFND